MESKYEFYEIVRVAPQGSHDSPGANLAGLEGAVLGKSQDEHGNWYYAVHIYNLNEVHFLPEQELEPTGRSDKRETFYEGDSMTVTVDPETGAGKGTRLKKTPKDH